MVTKIATSIPKRKRRRIRYSRKKLTARNENTLNGLRADIYGMYVGILDSAILAPDFLTRQRRLQKFRDTLRSTVNDLPGGTAKGCQYTIILEMIEALLRVSPVCLQRRELIKFTNTLRQIHQAIPKEC